VFPKYLCLAAERLESFLGPDETRDPSSAPPV